MTKDYWVSTKRMTFWVEVTDGVISDSAPIGRKFIGQPYTNLIAWLRRQGGLQTQEL